MSETITVPFSHLVLRHREIGVHRGRRWGFRDVFGFATLRDVPFVTLARRVKDAYEGRDVPDHSGWPDQREALRWLVEKGHDGIYALDEQGIKLMDRRPRERRTGDVPLKLPSVGGGEVDPFGGVTPGAVPGGQLVEEATTEGGLAGMGVPERYYISDGHHRALALYVLGAQEVRARFGGVDVTDRELHRSVT